MEWEWKLVDIGGQGKVYRRGEEKVVGILRGKIYECAFCRGTGKKPGGTICPTCRGKGEVSVEPPAAICAYCKGRGEEHPRTNVTCTVCRGKGVVSIQEPIEICPHCRGTGAEPTNKLPCLMCKGKGIVTIKGQAILEMRGMNVSTRRVQREQQITVMSTRETSTPVKALHSKTDDALRWQRYRWQGEEEETKRLNEASIYRLGKKLIAEEWARVLGRRTEDPWIRALEREVQSVVKRRKRKGEQSEREKELRSEGNTDKSE